MWMLSIPYFCNIMKFHVIFIFVFVSYPVDAKRYSGGSWRSSGSGSKSTSSWGGLSRPKPLVSKTTSNLPSSFNAGKTSSDFLFRESGRPSRPALVPSSPGRNSPTFQNSHPSAPVSSSRGFHNPSAPFPTHTNTFPTKPVTHDHHQQSSASVSHSDPYLRQPAQNPHVSNTPYFPSLGYGDHSSHIPAPPPGISLPTSVGSHSAPYPNGAPNHPHPSNMGSSSFPMLSAHPPPYSVNPPVHTQHVPSVHSSYSPGPPPTYGSPSYSHGGLYQPPPPYSAHAPVYHTSPAYSAPSSPFIPGQSPTYVIADSRSKGPGFGSIIGGAVAGGVAAGATNAIVDHAINSIFRPSSHHVHTYPTAPPVGTPTTSVIHTTNNYYYGQSGTTDTATNVANQEVNQGSAQAQPPQGTQSIQANAPISTESQTNPGTTSAPIDSRGNPVLSTNGAVSRTPENQHVPDNDDNIISDDKIMQLTEELFDKQDKNTFQYIELVLQRRVSSTKTESGAVSDEAVDPLFVLKPELDTIPTVSTLKVLYKNYQRDGFQKENFTPERINEENLFLDEITKTPVMKRALDWLAERKFVEPIDSEKKDLLKRIWFTSINETSSGFERIFLSEKFGDSGLIGMQNWIYFAYLESQKNVDYLGYVDMLSLSGKGSLVKLNYRSEGFTIQNATIFAGTPPELELALYTICVQARSNNWCPISLGGAKFFILTRSFRQYGKDIIDLGFPVF